MPAQGDEKIDESQIRNIVQDHETAWNKGSAQDHAAKFQIEGAFTVILGVTYDTRAVLEEPVGQTFTTIFKGSTINRLGGLNTCPTCLRGSCSPARLGRPIRHHGFYFISAKAAAASFLTPDFLNRALAAVVKAASASPRFPRARKARPRL